MTTVTPGLVQLALALAFASAPSPERTIPAGPRPVEAPLAPAELRGQVESETVSLELAAVSIEIECDCFARAQRLRVDLRGEFSFTGLTPGSYVVRARHEQLLVERRVELRAGEQLALTLDFDAAQTVEPPAPVVQPRPAGAVFARTADEGAGLRRYGLGFTVAGVVLGVGGLIAAYHNPCGKDGARGSNCETDVRNAVALTLGVAGFGSITGGVLAMAIGQSLEQRARLEAASLGFALRLDPGGGGLVVGGRF